MAKRPFIKLVIKDSVRKHMQILRAWPKPLAKTGVLAQHKLGVTDTSGAK